ncbi:MAG TPA: response regulator transcription factor, partial [Polyangia bacterium]
LLPAYVEIALGAGALEEARAACVELESIAADFRAEILNAMAAHARGAVELAAGRPQAALAPLRRSLGAWQRLAAPYLAARVRALLAQSCRALGDEETATLERGLAREVFERLGARPDLQAARAPGPRAPEEAPAGLTARELQVLRLVATGKTNKTIARELFLSEKTVDRHVSNILMKLDVGSRAAATAYAYEHRLI